MLELSELPDLRVEDPREGRADDRQPGLPVAPREGLAEEMLLLLVGRVGVAGPARPELRRDRQPRDAFPGQRESGVKVPAPVGPARQVRAPVDVEVGERGLERQEHRGGPDAGGAAEELERGEALLQNCRSEERLAALHADVDRVVAEVLRQEAAGDDLAGRREREGPLDVLQVLVVGVVADGKDAAKAVRKVVGDLIEPHLPAVESARCKYARRSVSHRARPVAPRGDLGSRHAHGRVPVVDRVALEDAGRLEGRRPAKLLAEAVRPARIEVQVRGQVGRSPRDPVVRQTQVRPAPAVVSDAGNEEPRGAVFLGRPDEIGRVKERHRADSKRDVLHVRVVVQGHRRFREIEGPGRVGHGAGREDAVMDAVGRFSELLDPFRDDVVRGGEVGGRVFQPAGLRLELKGPAAPGHPRGALVDDHVAFERRRLRREVVAPLVRPDLHVLVLDLDVLGAFPEDVLLVVDRLPGREMNLASPLRRFELDLEVALRLHPRLERVRRAERLLRGKGRRDERQEDRDGTGNPHASIGRSSGETRKEASVLARIFSTVTSGASSTNTSSRRSRSTSKTHRSVMIR